MITVEGLTKIYGNRTALDNVSFEVPKGEIFGFVGPNGAGKTTTLRILAALLQPTSGRALVDGADVIEHPDLVHERLGYMPDFFGVYDQLTAGEYLDFYAACYRLPKARRKKIADDLLELVGLSDRRDQAVDTLSRGLKQRLWLGRARGPADPGPRLRDAKQPKRPPTYAQAVRILEPHPARAPRALHHDRHHRPGPDACHRTGARRHPAAARRRAGAHHRGR